MGKLALFFACVALFFAVTDRIVVYITPPEKDIPPAERLLQEFHDTALGEQTNIYKRAHYFFRYGTLAWAFLALVVVAMRAMLAVEGKGYLAEVFTLVVMSCAIAMGVYSLAALGAGGYGFYRKVLKN